MGRTQTAKKQELLRHVREAKAYLDDVGFYEAVDELIFIALNACDPDERFEALGRALTNYAQEVRCAGGD